MASSNSAPADGALPAARHSTLETIREQTAAIDELIGLARESIRVFDGDLSETGWNAPARCDALAAFLRGSRRAQMQIIVHDTHWIEASAPRLMALLKAFSHAITIYRTGAEAQGAMDPLVIVDGRHFLHRFHVDHPRAALGVDAPQETRPLQNRFDEIWATGEPGITATTLGL
jgi:hypothetical protein